ncbi:sensor histidine kinase KdpD [Herpetosiphon gulosus]|uniref:histidine kinase n=1 Tax=Herpetosiphon gulosus TaxID=1973496 RepID=A0ABP9X296_9CHLR
MEHQRPNPDQLLERIQSANQQAQRGRLKVFFGAAAGVGKTYAMLQAAQQRRAEGIDVLVGYIETHGRAETDALLVGLPQLPALQVEYRGTNLREFDLDAALERKPSLILVDELAHSNAPNLRHAKRWQDINELLHAGIDVYTTVNVQHLESLNDVVAQVTGVIVRETVPDAVLESADEVELIDLPPDELLGRLNEGKIYIASQAAQAARNFFRKGNLIALRELALRRTADRVDAQMQRYRHDHAIPTTWPTRERLLVGVGPSPLSERLVRATRRMANDLKAEWLVVYVETPKHLRLSDADRDRVTATLRLAESLGAQIVTLGGINPGEEMLRYARQRNVSKIVVGKPAQPRWRELLFGSIVDQLIRQSGEIDVYVISGEHDDTHKPKAKPSLQTRSPKINYVKSSGVVLICTALSHAIFPHLELSNLIMVYLLGVTWVAARYGRGPAISASILSVAAFDFFFVQPYLTFAVSDVQYILTFIVMLIVALTISTLTVQIQAQAETARQRERRTAALYAMTREFASIRGLDNLLQTAAQHISSVFEGQTAILLPNPKGQLRPIVGQQWPFISDQRELITAQWVYDHQQKAGMHSDTLPSAQAMYLPLIATRGIVGVLALQPEQPRRLLDPSHVHLLETFANQTTVAIERAHLAEEAQAASVQIETERMRNSLLSSVSHDLRTPLAAISGAASTLLDQTNQLDQHIQHELIQTIADEGQRLNRLLSNLLDMTRLEAGAVQVHKEWQSLEEVLGTALARLAPHIDQRSISIELPNQAFVPFDSILIEQVLVNLLENSLKYTPSSSPIEIRALERVGLIEVQIADHGPGIPTSALETIFEKFFRVQAKRSASSGVGLGLTICRGIIEAHGGTIWAENRPEGGAIFAFTLPIEGQPPQIRGE